MKQNAWLVYLLVLFTVVSGSWGTIFYSHHRQEQEYAAMAAKSEVLFQRQIYDEALDLCRKCSRIHPKDLDIIKRTAAIYYQTEKYDRAIKECDHMARLAPERQDAGLLKAMCYEKKEDWYHAAQVLKKIKDSPRAAAMLRKARGKYTLDYKMMDWVSPWFRDERREYYSVAGKASKSAMISANGKVQFQGDFTKLGQRSTGKSLYPANTGNLWCFVDGAGKRRLVPGEKYEFLGPQNGNLALVKQGGFFGYVDSHFNKANFGYEEAYNYCNGRALVQKHGLYLMVEEHGKVVKQCSFHSIRSDGYGNAVRYGVMIAEKDGKQQLYNSNATLLNDFSADELRFPEETHGLMAFRQGDRWGYVSRYGQVIIAPAFEDARSFSQGYAAVKLNGKWGYIGTDGKLLIPVS